MPRSRGRFGSVRPVGRLLTPLRPLIDHARPRTASRIPPERFGPPLNPCDRHDLTILLSLAQGIAITRSNPQTNIVPGSTVRLYGHGFSTHLPRERLPIRLRVTSWGPPVAGILGAPQHDEITSWIVISDQEIAFDVPLTVSRGTGVVHLLAGEQRCVVVSGGRFVTRDGAVTMASFRTLTFADPDPPLVSVQDLQARILPDGSVQLTWTDISGERWYWPHFRRRGNIGWLGPSNRPMLPASTTSVRFPGSELTEVTGARAEEHEFRLAAANYSGRSFSNIAGIGYTRGASVRIAPTAPLANPFCQAEPEVVQLSAFFDQDSDGTVAGFPAADPGVTFPADLVVNILAAQGYDIVPGSMFARGQATRANLVVVARFFSCPHQLPQFVVAHMVVFGERPNFTFQGIRLMAGDEFSDPPNPEEADKGVVLTGGFDAQMDIQAFADNVAKGRAAGDITQGVPQNPYGVSIEFEFETPIEAR